MNSWGIPRTATTEAWGFPTELEVVGGAVQEEWTIQNTAGFHIEYTANYSYQSEVKKEEMRNQNSNGRTGLVADGTLPFLETALCWKDQILGTGIEEVTLHIYQEWNSQPSKEKILGVGLG